MGLPALPLHQLAPSCPPVEPPTVQSNVMSIEAILQTSSPVHAPTPKRFREEEVCRVPKQRHRAESYGQNAAGAFDLVVAKEVEKLSSKRPLQVPWRKYGNPGTTSSLVTPPRSSKGHKWISRTTHMPPGTTVQRFESSHTSISHIHPLLEPSEL